MATHVGKLPDRPIVDERPAWRLREALRAAVDDLAKQFRRPAAVHRVAELAPAERVLTYTCDFDEASVVATNCALHRLSGEGAEERWWRWGWEQIARVHWNPEELTLTVFGLLPAVASRTVLRLRERSPLVGLAEERVAWTRQLDTRVQLAEYGTARVTVRRQPGSDRMYWVVRADEGVDTDDPSVRAVLDAELARLRVDIGL